MRDGREREDSFIDSFEQDKRKKNFPFAKGARGKDQMALSFYMEYGISSITSLLSELLKSEGKTSGPHQMHRKQRIDRAVVIS